MTIRVGWHRPPSRSLAPPRRGGRRTGGEKARVLLSTPRFLLRPGLSNSASYCVSGPAPEFVSRAALPRLGLRSILLRPSTPSAPASATAKPPGHRALPARCSAVSGEGVTDTLRVSLTRTYTLRNLKGMSAGVSKPRSDAWPPAPCPPPKRPSVAARHRVLQNTFPPSLHLNHFPSSPARVGIAGSVGEGGTHLF